MSEVRDPYRVTLADRFWGCGHPLAVIILVGVAVHLFLMLGSVNYDSDFWALVARNIETGEGLYGVEGYYYTPVWGYLIGLVSMFQTFFMTIGETAVRVVEFLPVEGMDGFFLSATVPAVSFMMSVKVPLLLSDLAMAYVVHGMVMDRTQDEKKAVTAFALVFLCPILLGSSCIVGMPDTVSALFAVLTVALVWKNHNFLAGMTFCMASLTKFFPVFMMFILVAYLLAKNRDDRPAAYRGIAMAVAGTLFAAALVFLPQLVSGNIEQCFQFLTDRTGSSENDSLLQFIAGKARIVVYLLIIAATVLISWKLLHREKEKLDDALVAGSLLAMGLCMLYPPTPQYLCVLVPFLVLWLMLRDRRFVRSYAVISAGAFSFCMLANCMLYASLAVWTDLISLETVLEINRIYLENSALLLKLVFVGSAVVQYAGILILMWNFFGDRIHPKRKMGTDGC